jgi:hypothetical protein
MPTSGIFDKILAWAARHERRLGAALFAFGFLTDIFTFGLLPVGVVNIFFVAYLTLAAVCTFGTHILPFTEEANYTAWWKRTFAVLFPLGAQYAIGGLLSGMVVFYTKSSVLSVSWPFILLIATAYVGSEYFRMYKHYLIFQTALFFFTLYAYAIFALPLMLGQLGPWIFAGSTVAALSIFSLFLFVLRSVNRNRFEQSFKQIASACLGIVIALNIAYFTELIPPIPLALADSGVYHTIVKVPDGYRAEGEEARPWWDIRPSVIHHVPGTLVYAYSAIQAPISFSSKVVHRWEYFDPTEKDWITESRIAFPISGGRAGGYRGYTERDTLTPGKWRVSVETPNGQVIGRIRFDVEDSGTEPALIEKAL